VPGVLVQLVDGFEEDAAREDGGDGLLVLDAALAVAL